jgi:hypothetical protein
MRLVLFSGLAFCLLVGAPAAAKEFPPGALRICGASECRIATPAQSNAFSALLWGDRPVARAPTPRVGSPVYQLRFRNGPVGAIISPTAIRVHGLRCGRFRRGRWYRLPRTLHGVAAGLEPTRLWPGVPRSC